MSQCLVRKDDDRAEKADYSPSLGMENGSVLQEVKLLNDPQLNPRRCSQVITMLLYMLNQGEAFSKIGKLGLLLLWHFAHFVVSIWYFAVGIAYMLESYLVASGAFKEYKTLDIAKLQYLAIVIESGEAYETSKVITLLKWLAAIGVKHICLYDTEGVLKKSKETILENSNATFWEGLDKRSSLLDQKLMTIEFASFSDGKEAVAKAANLLFMNHLKLGGDLMAPIFTERNITDALRAIGCKVPDPDLLLVYGPARCHLGFPAWRMRYTEIVHMGTLKSMKFGSLVKAIHKYTMVHQNYGR